MFQMFYLLELTSLLQIKEKYNAIRILIGILFLRDL